MCKLPCFEGKRCKNMQTLQKTWDLDDFVEKRPFWHWLHVCCCYCCGTMHFLAIVYFPSLSNFPPLTYKDWLASQQNRSSCSTPPLAPVTDQKNLQCGRPPHAKRDEYINCSMWQKLKRPETARLLRSELQYVCNNNCKTTSMQQLLLTRSSF